MNDGHIPEVEKEDQRTYVGIPQFLKKCLSCFQMTRGVYNFVLFFAVLRFEPRASYMLGNHATT
jgi:hypothetical protein